MGSEKQWLLDVSVCAVHGDTAWYVCYETKTHRLRLTHRGTWSMDDMDIYFRTNVEARVALNNAPCPLEDPYARIAELESTIAHLRNVASEQHAWEEMAERCGLQLKPEAAEKNVNELREAVRVLAVYAHRRTLQAQKLDTMPYVKQQVFLGTLGQAKNDVLANQIAAEAVREASNG